MRDPKNRKCEPSPAGDVYHTLYKTKVHVDGSFDLIEDGKENWQEYIDSFRESTDMSYILKQLAIGNTQVVNQTPGYYGDFTKMPSTMAEAMQIMMDAETAFYELPLDIRNNFDNNVSIWLATAGQEDWSKKMNFVKDEVDLPKEEVSTDVS